MTFQQDDEKTHSCQLNKWNCLRNAPTTQPINIKAWTEETTVALSPTHLELIHEFVQTLSEIHNGATRMVVWDGTRENKPRSRKAVARTKRRTWAKEENAAKQWGGKAEELDDEESKMWL